MSTHVEKVKEALTVELNAARVERDAIEESAAQVNGQLSAVRHEVRQLELALGTIEKPVRVKPQSGPGKKPVQAARRPAQVAHKSPIKSSITPDGRKRISAYMKKRWAEHRSQEAEKVAA